MPRAEFITKNLADWSAAIATLGVEPDSRVTWEGTASIIRALTPVMGVNLNHALLPGGGGLDFEGVVLSRERGCLEFTLGRRSAYLVKPKRLIFEKLTPDGQSFYLLELDQLEPSGVYDEDADEPSEGDDQDEPTRVRDYEELLEVTPGDYRPRDVWDRGFLHYREDGAEVPLPPSSRLVVRILKGKILIVAKASLWNSDPATYDGRHTKLTSKQIRSAIEHAIADD